MEFLIFLIVIIIIGALLGGKSFGGTVRKGCGFLLLLIIGVFFYSQTDSKNTDDNQDAISITDNSAYFISKEKCQTYIKPNIESDVSGSIEIGMDFFVEDVNKFTYFYELTCENKKSTFVKKECLKRK